MVTEWKEDQSGNIYDVPFGSLSSRVSINSSKLDFVSGAVEGFSFELYIGFKDCLVVGLDRGGHGTVNILKRSFWIRLGLRVL